MHGLCIAFISHREKNWNQILTSNMDHNDTEQSFCQYLVKHVHILTEDNRLNH